MVGHAVALLTVFAVPWTGALPARAEIAPGYIDKIVRAYGGETALERTGSYRIVAETIALRRGGKSGRVVRDFEAPDRLRVSIEYPDSVEVRILNGDRGWRGTDGEPVEARGPLLDSMAYQLLRSDLPGALARNRDRLVDGGLAQDEAGRAYRILVLPWSDTLSVRYWIESGSLRATRVVGVLQAGPTSIEFGTEYGDFRQVDGVWVPFREINHASGAKVAETVVRDVRWNPDALGPFAPD